MKYEKKALTKAYSILIAAILIIAIVAVGAFYYSRKIILKSKEFADQASHKGGLYLFNGVE